MKAKAVLRYYRELQQGVDRRKFYREYEAQRAAAEAQRDDEAGEIALAIVDDAKILIVDPDETWTPPAKSKALARYPSRSTHSSRGNIVDPGTYRCVGFSSNGERRCALILMANCDVVDVEEQNPRITYIDDMDESHVHIVDMRATFRDGRRVAVSVKEQDRVEATSLDVEVAAIRRDLSGYADALLILTDRELTAGRADNAQSVIYARGLREEEHCVKLREMLHNCYGIVSAVHLANLFPYYADGWVAVLCLVYDKVLAIVHPDTRLEDTPYVTVNRVTLEGYLSTHAA